MRKNQIIKLLGWKNWKNFRGWFGDPEDINKEYSEEDVSEYLKHSRGLKK